MAFIFPFGKKNSPEEDGASQTTTMNPASAPKSTGAIPDFPFRDPAPVAPAPTPVAVVEEPSVTEETVPPPAATQPEVSHIIELRNALETTVQEAIRNFHAYVDAVIAERATAPAPSHGWALPEGRPTRAFPAADLSTTEEEDSVRLDPAFKESLDTALARAFSETPAPAAPAPESPAPQAPAPPVVVAENKLSSPSTGLLATLKRTILPLPKNSPFSAVPAAEPAPAPFTAAPSEKETPAVAAALEPAVDPIASPFSIQTPPAAEPSVPTPFALVPPVAAAEVTAPPPPAAEPLTSPFSPFSVVESPVTAPPLPEVKEIAPPPTALEAVAVAPPPVTPVTWDEEVAAEATSPETAEVTTPPSRSTAPTTPVSPFSPIAPEAAPRTAPPAASPAPSESVKAPLPFSPFQGLEPAPPPPLLDRAETSGDPQMFRPVVSENAAAWGFGAPLAAVAEAPAATPKPATVGVAELEPEPLRPLSRTAPAPVKTSALPPSRLPSAPLDEEPSGDIGFSFAELLKANGQSHP